LSDHDTIDQVTKELHELRRLEVLNDRSLAAALRYVNEHRSEVVEMYEVQASSISDVVDSVVDIARGSCNC